MQNILLIEDNVYDAELIQAYLTNDSKETVLDVSHTMTEAVERTKAFDYDMILTDLSLPDSDGLASVQKLKEATENVPIIVLTGSDDKEMALQAVREGAQDYLVKGKINAAVLSRVITYAQARQKQLTDLHYLAFHDNLTGLGNRAMLMHNLENNLEQVNRYGGQFALHMMDLTGFKAINDTHGHDAGDALLKMVAERLASAVRVVDSVARFGGDEFVVLQHGVKKIEDVHVMTKKLMKIFNQTFTHNGKELTCSSSIGSALYPDHADSAVALLKHADIALYEGKKADAPSNVIYTADLIKSYMQE